MTKLYQKTVLPPVSIHRRQWNVDGRGQLIEGLRNDDELYNNDFGQVYVTTVCPGIIKAWHYHKDQTDRMLLLHGLVRFVAYDSHEKHVNLDLVVDSRDPYLIVIPKGLYHGFQNIGSTDAFILNIPDKVYNRENPDEQRCSPYSDSIPFNWDIQLHG